MAAPKQRRHALYLLAVTSGPLVIVRAPDHFMAGRALVHAIWRALKRDHGLRKADFSSLEGLAGNPDPSPADRADDALDIPKLEAAFAGDPERFRAFDLYAWAAEAGEFQRVRKGTQR